MMVLVLTNVNVVVLRYRFSWYYIWYWAQRNVTNRSADRKCNLQSRYWRVSSILEVWTRWIPEELIIMIFFSKKIKKLGTNLNPMSSIAIQQILTVFTWRLFKKLRHDLYQGRYPRSPQLPLLKPVEEARPNLPNPNTLVHLSKKASVPLLH